jgi:hypothetical protein
VRAISRTPRPELSKGDALALLERQVPPRHGGERAAQPLVGGWTPADLAIRISAERVDRAENLAAVLAAILRRYALAPPRTSSAPAAGPPNTPDGPNPAGALRARDPSGCTACSFCRRGLATRTVNGATGVLPPAARGTPAVAR